jgi:glucosamine-6-phosphate deaminase
MKTDLSSQITLTRIPQRYYRPENAFEHSVLTRLEKIPTNIYESADEGSFAIAQTARTFKSLSKIRISASLPRCKEPLRS